MQKNACLLKLKVQQKITPEQDKNQKRLVKPEQKQGGNTAT
jgi:hypothetical protein